MTRPPARRYVGRALAALLLSAPGTDRSALAQQPATLQQQRQADAKAAAPGFWQRGTLTGDWAGLRTALSDRGVAFSGFYVGEAFANVSGGIKRGATYDGLFLPQADIDLQKLVGWRGASASVSMIQGHGPSISTGYTGDLLGVSSTTAIPPATRLYSLWLQQNLFGDALSIRAGLMNVDAEFMTSATAAVFVNPGWVGFDLPGGGPAYPLSSPGIRVRLRPGPDGAYVQTAVFAGDPTGHHGSNTATALPRGTVISFNGGAFTIAEIGYATHQPGESGAHAAAYRLGGWYHTSKRFADERYATNGLSLIDPASTGIPREHKGNWAVYGMADATLYRAGTVGIDGFGRIGTSPGDRNLLTFYFDAGIAIRGLAPTRPGDALGVSIGYAQIGRNARGLDRDRRAVTTTTLYPVRNQEIVLELTYQAQLTPWMVVQPDVQYVINPSGRVLNENGSIRQNALILGLRSTLTF